MIARLVKKMIVLFPFEVPLYEAAGVDTAPPAERRRAVSAAKIKVADACRHVSQEAVQLHGGMGMTEENCPGRFG